MSALRGIKEKYLSLQKFPNSEFQIPIRPRSSTDRIKDSGSLDLGSIPSEVASDGFLDFWSLGMELKNQLYN